MDRRPVTEIESDAPIDSLEHHPRIAINAVSATAGGGLTVSRNLSEHLSRARPDWEFTLFISKPDAQPVGPPANLNVSLDRANGTLLRRWRWEQSTFPDIESEHRFDATILLGGFTSFRSKKPQIAVWQNAQIWSAGLPDQSVSARMYIFVQRQLMRLSTRYAAHNVFLSRDSVKECGKRVSLLAKRCHVIPIGPEGVFFSERQLPALDERGPMLLAVSDFYPHKRIEVIIDALDRLRSDHPELKLQIAGRPIDKEYHRNLMEKVSQLKLQDRVSFLGGVSTEDLLTLYANSRIYVTATSLETFGLTPVEAMSCGLPVIAALDSATPEICGDAAIYFESGAGSLAESIDTLLNDDEQWRNLQRSGIRRARQFSWDRIANQYAELIEKTLQDAQSK